MGMSDLFRRLFGGDEENGRAGNGEAGSSEPDAPIADVDPEDPETEVMIAKARAELPGFLDEISNRRSDHAVYMFKARIETEHGVEHVWMSNAVVRE
ncbi:MAG: hypothetical protein VX528_07505, partial [Candidatus Latescibacterota bacterium]|nr:hypothetical protein [Candidatus Latescibacterota bacterium]